MKYIQTFSGLSPVFFTFLLSGVQAQYEEQTKIGCNAQYCIDKQIIQTCNPPPNCTTVGYRKFLSPRVCNCCEYCYNYLEKGDDCQTLSQSLPNNMCGPLLQCMEVDENTGAQQCVPMDRENSCIGAYNAYQSRVEKGTDGVADFEPDCDAHGFYVPRQCLPGSTICVCMNDQGEQIFGAGAIRSPMDCACSRDVARLQSFGFTGNFPHCLPNGDYDELQCSLPERKCYCRQNPGDTVDMKHLDKLKSCYNPALHPPTYIRWCEVERAEARVLLADAKESNTTILVGDIPNCDPDGHYAPVQSRNQKWVCVDPNGKQIESFEETKKSGNPNVPENFDCHCAKRRYLMGDSAAGKPKCCRNGRYRPWQCIGSTCFCVDNIGRQDMTKNPAEVPQDEASRLECYVAAVVGVLAQSKVTCS